MKKAKESGFYKRKSKISPMVFLDLMMYDVSTLFNKSLNQLAIEAKSEHSIEVSKQGVDKKFKENVVSFIKLLIEEFLSQKFEKELEAGWLSSFNRVCIKDGTRFNIPENFKDHFPGSGGSGSKAGACLQFEYDLKSGSILDLNLTAANRPDVTDAKEVVDTISSNDLVIRDLGYYAFSSLENIINKRAYFISRLGYKTNVYQNNKGKIEKLDFEKLYYKMKKNNLSRVCKKVMIGNQAKIPVRMIVELLPDNIFEARMIKTNKLHRKKGYQTSKEYKFMSRFNIFITNTYDTILPDQVVPVLYKMRWQIELIFKIWKSVIGIHHSRKMKFCRWLCLLHFKLLLMIINWNVIMQHRNNKYEHNGQLLSMNKCFKTLVDNSYRFREALKKGTKALIDFLNWSDKIFKKNHFVEKKNKSIGIEKIFYSLYCQSNIYVYI